MAIFKFEAKKMKTGAHVKVEVFLGGKSRGFTSERAGSPLMVETTQSGSFSWYAKRMGSKVDSGESSGGNILIAVD
ncbi:hypothetical protein [Psychrosphaera aestuarii]|uniref:hypothetical protein n=1 Tax=Psychrosphaera aestuarii TaxID=1266052 RepID=UPI001B3431AE|nr:hypothetical protein [Psychrosphaera aestuarii]